MSKPEYNNHHRQFSAPLKMSNISPEITPFTKNIQHFSINHTSKFSMSLAYCAKIQYLNIIYLFFCMCSPCSCTKNVIFHALEMTRNEENNFRIEKTHINYPICLSHFHTLTYNKHEPLFHILFMITKCRMEKGEILLLSLRGRNIGGRIKRRHGNGFSYFSSKTFRMLFSYLSMHVYVGW